MDNRLVGEFNIYEWFLSLHVPKPQFAVLCGSDKQMLPTVFSQCRDPLRSQLPRAPKCQVRQRVKVDLRCALQLSDRDFTSPMQKHDLRRTAERLLLNHRRRRDINQRQFFAL